MAARIVISALLCLSSAARAGAGDPKQAAHAGEKGFQYEKKSGSSQRQGSTDAETISIDPAFRGKTLQELKILVDDPDVPLEQRGALKQLIETSERQQAIADGLPGTRSSGRPDEPSQGVQYTRPAGYENLNRERSGNASPPPGKPVLKQRAAPREGAFLTREGAAKAAERKVPLDLSRPPGSPGYSAGETRSVPFLNDPPQFRPPSDATERALQQERRMPSFMRAAAGPRPPSPALALEKARRYMRTGKLIFAEQEVRAAIARDARDALAHVTLLQILIERKEYAPAVEQASRSAQEHPHDPRIYFLRALAFEQLGDMEARMADLRIAASLDPDRFQRYLLSAKDGEVLYDPKAGGNWRLLDIAEREGGTGVQAEPSRSLLLILGSVMGAALAGGLLFFLRAKRRSRPLAAVTEPSVRPLKTGSGAPPLETGSRGPPRGRTPAYVIQLRRGMTLARKYSLVRFLGHDGTVEIWKANDRTLDRCVLIKRLYAGDRGHGTPERERRLQEARTAAKLHHPNIAELYEILDIASGLYIVYEYTPGKSIHQILEELGCLPAAQVRDILAPACRALEHAHQRGVAHGGLSPERIVVTKNGYVKITDFVLARTTGEGAERYAAPEAKRGDPMPVSDIYSLGLCCYEMLTGELPNVGQRESDPQVEELLEKTLDLDFRTRMADAKLLLKTLEEMTESLRDPPRPSGVKKGKPDDDQSGTETEATA